MQLGGDNPVFDHEDFQLNFHESYHDERVARVTHFFVDEEHRGKLIASAILETLVRVAYYEGYEVIEVSMGGEIDAVNFLRRNGFTIIRRRWYDHSDNCEYGVDAVRRIYQPKSGELSKWPENNEV